MATVPLQHERTAPDILDLDSLLVKPLTSYHGIEFVDVKASERFICIICSEVAFEPPNQECGHIHCRSCLERAMRVKKICPQCREPLPSRSELLQLCGYVQREILQLQVRCMPNMAAHGKAHSVSTIATGKSTSPSASIGIHVATLVVRMYHALL
jgi:hypothetical protein